jgi:hypothetical protein
MDKAAMTAAPAPQFTILEALHAPELFRPWFRDPESWQAWRSFLCALFALPMTDAEMETYCQCTGRTVAPTKQAREAHVIVGRRGGKSQTLAALAVFTGCFGSFREYTSPGEMCKIPILASDREQSGNILGYVRSMLTEIPMLRTMVKNSTADSFELKNGLTISVQTASFRGARGFSSPLILCDESAFWYNEGSANPDVEIHRALKPAMATIPNSMLISASSPFAKKGVLWDAYQKYYGKDSDVLVWKAPTLTMRKATPRLQAEIDEAYTSDPAAASAEWGAEFRSDISSFVDLETVLKCVDAGVKERPFDKSIRYSAFVDPSGGSSDSMTLAIGHRVGDIHVLDVIREIPAPFEPESAVAEFVKILKAYSVRQVVGDRYAAAWSSTAFERHGIRYLHSPMNRSELYLETLAELNSKRVRLLDVQRLISQFASLVRRTSRGGRDTVDHSPGGRDDCSNAVAGLIAIGATPGNSVSVIQDFGHVLNPDNWRTLSDGTRKFEKAIRIVPHPTKGLPGFMRS